MSWYDAEDLSRGLEPLPVRVSQTNVPLPSFQYMSRSRVHAKADINYSLRRLGEGEYCVGCMGDCLSAEVPCECTRETGGQYAYKPGGILKDRYLQQGISDATYCAELEGWYCGKMQGSAGGYDADVGLEVCEGHVQRTFIKECNVKCSCHYKCGNRVVQQGMRYPLEVFRTTLMGWGIRAIEPIPRGAFVFELAGEILTNAEMIVRNFGVLDGQSYGLQLDADWATEQVVNDDAALCIDSTHFGNVARFLNHRSVSKRCCEVLNF